MSGHNSTYNTAVKSELANRPASKLLIEEPALQVLPSLAVAVGLNEAMFIQQLHYWLRTSQNIYDGKAWVYNTYEQWQEQFPFWSVPTIRRVTQSLKDKKLLLVQKVRCGFGKQINWYSIDYQELGKHEATSLSKSAAGSLSKPASTSLSKSAAAGDQYDHTDQNEAASLSKSAAAGDQYDHTDLINMISQCDQNDQMYIRNHRLPTETTYINNSNKGAVVLRLFDSGNGLVPKETLGGLLDKYPEAKIQEQLTNLRHSQGVKNAPGWLAGALKNNYAHRPTSEIKTSPGTPQEFWSESLQQQKDREVDKLSSQNDWRDEALNKFSKSSHRKGRSPKGGGRFTTSGKPTSGKSASG